MTKILNVTEPLNRVFTAYGCMPVRADEPDEWVSVTGTPSQSRVVLSGPFWKVVEVAALVPAGTTKVGFVPGVNKLGSLVTPAILRQFVKQPSAVLKIEGHNGIVESVAFGDSEPWVKGQVRLGHCGTIHTQNFGTFRWWTVANAQDRRVWMTLRWSNAVRADGTARPEFLFRSVSIEGLPAGVSWRGALPDPIMRFQYLVKPNNHVFPQRGIRDFRIVFHESINTNPRGPSGWGTGDWTEGGWLGGGLKIPKLSNIGTVVENRANKEWNSFANNTGTGGTLVEPVLSDLWSYAGVTYGGMSGEEDIWGYDGVLTAASSLREGLDMHRVLMTRYGLRQRLIFEADGKPVVPENHLNNGNADWSMFDFQFQQQFGADGGFNDSPWNFDKQPRPVGPRAYEPSTCMPIDSQHLIRCIKDARALIWLDGDPAAVEYITCMAEHARMTYWHGQGRARRMMMPTEVGKGIDVGREHAWSGSVIATAQLLGRANMGPWLAFFKRVCEQGMTPCGLFAASRSGKAATTPPMNSQYRVQRGNEMSYFAQLFQEMSMTGLEMDALKSAFREGIRKMAWCPGFGGCWDRHAVGTADGANMYLDRSQVPEGVYDPDVMDRWTYYAGGIVGALDIPELYDEWSYIVGLTEGRVIVDDGAPIEVYLPAYARWHGVS